MSASSRAGSARTIFPDEAKAFMDEHPEGTYTLLDVRQPFEYEEGHLPGATLLPLPDLADSLGELDAGKPLLVYCAVGGRSRMAAQLLANQGFQEVYHVEGGIDAWEYHTASGPTGFHLQFVRGDETPLEVIATAYRMEEGLLRFHEAVREQAGDEGLKEVLRHLIKAEEGHMKSLMALLDAVASEEEKRAFRESLPSIRESTLMEGGLDMAAFMKQNERFLQSVTGYLEVAMTVETQALDLYLRMAGESKNPAAREALYRIGQEEKGHLALLAQFMEKYALRQ